MLRLHVGCQKSGRFFSSPFHGSSILGRQGLTQSYRQSIGGKTQTTKSKAANRPIALSPHLAAHLSLRREADSNLLIFRTKKETPWDHNLVRKRKLYPLCRKLGIACKGFKSFRHGQATLQDQMSVPVKRCGNSEWGTQTRRSRSARTRTQLARTSAGLWRSWGAG